MNVITFGYYSEFNIRSIMKTIMKLFIGIIISFAFLFTNCIAAQNQNNNQLGIKGGFNVSSLSAEAVEANSIKLGI